MSNSTIHTHEHDGLGHPRQMPKTLETVEPCTIYVNNREFGDIPTVQPGQKVTFKLGDGRTAEARITVDGLFSTTSISVQSGEGTTLTISAKGGEVYGISANMAPDNFGDPMQGTIRVGSGWEEGR
jgi:hypothetical protein